MAIRSSAGDIAESLDQASADWRPAMFVAGPNSRRKIAVFASRTSDSSEPSTSTSSAQLQSIPPAGPLFDWFSRPAPLLRSGAGPATTLLLIALTCFETASSNSSGSSPSSTHGRCPRIAQGESRRRLHRLYAEQFAREENPDAGNTREPGVLSGAIAHCADVARVVK